MKRVIELQGVSKKYRDKKAVDHLSLAIEEGSIVALLGPNGAGKSMTVNMAYQINVSYLYIGFFTAPLMGLLRT